MSKKEIKRSDTMVKDIPAEHEQWFEEIRKADMRLRRWPDLSGGICESKPTVAALRWAIALSKADLTSLSEGDFRNLHLEVECFRRFRMRPPELLPYVVNRRHVPVMISGEGIAQIQQWLRQSFKSFSQKQSIDYVVPKQHWSLVPYVSIGKEENGWYFIPLHKLEGMADLYEKEFFELLRDHINDLAICEFEGCKTGHNFISGEKIYERGIYVRDRSNQHYCSKKCRWAAVKREAKNQQRKEDKMEKKTLQKERRTDAKKKRT